MDDVVGDGAELPVEVVGCCAKEFERGVTVYVVRRHEDPFRLSDDVAGLQRLVQVVRVGEVAFVQSRAGERQRGVRGEDGKLIQSLDDEESARLRKEGVIDGGMIPKVECALEAIAGGVRKCHIFDGREQHAILLEIFTDAGIGTEIVRRSPSAK